MEPEINAGNFEMNKKNMILSFAALMSFLACGQKAFAELNTHSSSESFSQPGSSAGSYNDFPIIGGNSAVLMPGGTVYSEQHSSPNPYFNRKIVADKAEVKPPHVVVGVVKNYYWPSSNARYAMTRRYEKRM